MFLIYLVISFQILKTFLVLLKTLSLLIGNPKVLIHVLSCHSFCALHLAKHCLPQTGRVFLVDKNNGNTEESRLVADFSQFSRGKHQMSFPKHYSPNLEALCRIVPMGMSRTSLDVSWDFYHIPMHPACASRLAVSDGQLVYYFRRPPMGVISALFSSISALLLSPLWDLGFFFYGRLPSLSPKSSLP